MNRSKDPELTSKQRLHLAGTLVILLWVLLLVACSACGARQIPDDVPTMSNPAVTRMFEVKDGRNTSVCTVWKLDENHIVTAGHCCEPDEVYVLDGPFAIPGEVILPVQRDDDDNDVCIIRAEMKGAPLPIASRDPNIGERVWTAGYPQGIFLISDGHWSGRDDSGRGVASVGVWGGASGSPLLNSKGQVVGVLVGYRPPQDNLAIVVPLEWLKINIALAP